MNGVACLSRSMETSLVHVEIRSGKQVRFAQNHRGQLIGTTPRTSLTNWAIACEPSLNEVTFELSPYRLWRSGDGYRSDASDLGYPLLRGSIA